MTHLPRSLLPVERSRVISDRSFLRSVRPFGPVYRGADMVISAIDALAEIITGEREYFSIGGSVGSDRREAMLKAKDEAR